MKKITIFLILSLVLFSCNDNKKKTSIKKEDVITIIVPNFNADSAYCFVKMQTDFGPRVPNMEAHKKCALFLQKQLEKYCDKVIAQSFVAKTFDGVKINCKNIIGSFAPENPKRILLAAHWDSRPFADHDPNPANKEQPIDGANDGASGVGVLLEIARQLSMRYAVSGERCDMESGTDYPMHEMGVDIIFFDAEDWGTKNSQSETGNWWCLGAQHWAKNPHITNYKAEYGILLDMVGAPNAKFLQEGVSMQYASGRVAKIWGTAYQLGYKDYFINTQGHRITDDHLYVNQITKIPMLNIIHQDQTTNTGFISTWHTLQDNISNIDKHTLYVVGTTVLAVIYGEE
jgi:Zn-dependent M28 family amino/carboxypeptidase